MLGKILTPLTTANSFGVATRYLTTMATTVVAMLGILGYLSDEQTEALTRSIPELLAAASAFVALVLPLYAILTKSSSDKAAEVAKMVDAEVPKQSPVVIQTPAGVPDIVVQAK